MACTSYYAADPHCEMFEMDGMDQPFAMEDDYGFYEDLDSDDDLAAADLAPLPSDDDSALSTPVCVGRIADADRDSLRTSPPILTPFVADAIAEDGLPWSMQDAPWDRLFSSSRDGASFGAFMRRVRGRGRTIVAARTSDGRVVGGYATGVWSGRKPSSDEDGAGHAFLFVVDPPAAAKDKQQPPSTPAAHTFIPGLADLGTSPTSALDFDFHQLAVSSSPNKARNDKPHVEFFKPDANAGFKQACQLGKKVLSMSDGSGDLSLVIEDSFSRGGVARTGDDKEEFTIVEFEVYGFAED